jgi:Fic family protein
MAALSRWTAAQIASRRFHPLLVVAAFVLEFLAIRPFADGNGRTSRMLTNLLLLQCGYDCLPYAPLEKVVEERKAEYYIALRKSQLSRHMPRQDPGPWAHAFLSALRDHARRLRAAVEGMPPDSILSDNQRRVLELLGRHGEVTNRLVARELGLSRETVKQTLGRLVSINALRRIGSGRAVRYRGA